MTIISWNVAGIKARLEDIGRLVRQYKPDVICFQKTRTKDAPLVAGYHATARCSDRWSGVATYIRCGLQASLIEADTHHLVTAFDDFILINAYAPFSNAKVPGYIEQRKEWDKWIVDFVKRQSKPVIICGDLNIVHTELDTFQKPHERHAGCYYKWERDDFNHLLEAGGLADAFRIFHREERVYTYFDTMHGIDYRALNQGSRLDYFLVSHRLVPHISGSDILTGFGSAPSVPITLALNLTQRS